MSQKNDNYTDEADKSRDELEYKDEVGTDTPEAKGEKTTGDTEETVSADTSEKAESVPEKGTADEAESERYLRLAAEFDNYKKRTAREFGEVFKRANERLLRSLIEIIDNFERALSHESDDNGGEAYRKGIELIYNQLGELLSKEQVTAIESIGQPFDPHYHEAIMQAESEEYGEGIVCQEIQKGYKIDDKVLRHARVSVSKGAPESKKE